MNTYKCNHFRKENKGNFAHHFHRLLQGCSAGNLSYLREVMAKVKPVELLNLINNTPFTLASKTGLN